MHKCRWQTCCTRQLLFIARQSGIHRYQQPCHGNKYYTRTYTHGGIYFNDVQIFIRILKKLNNYCKVIKTRSQATQSRRSVASAQSRPGCRSQTHTHTHKRNDRLASLAKCIHLSVILSFSPSLHGIGWRGSWLGISITRGPSPILTIPRINNATEKHKDRVLTIPWFKKFSHSCTN